MDSCGQLVLDPDDVLVIVGNVSTCPSMTRRGFSGTSMTSSFLFAVLSGFVFDFAENNFLFL